MIRMTSTSDNPWLGHVAAFAHSKAGNRDERNLYFTSNAIDKIANSTPEVRYLYVRFIRFRTCEAGCG
jgi:hypothetical protein